MKKTLILSFVLLSLALVSAKRYQCRNPPTDYSLHMKDSFNFGSETVPGYVSDEAYSFDGKGQYRDFGKTNLKQTLTVSFWARWSSFNTWSRIMDFGNGPASDNILVANEGGSANVIWEIYKTNQPNKQRRQNFLKQNVWNHFAMQITPEGKQTIFINGQETGEKYQGNHSGPLNQVERKFSYLGRSLWGNDKYFNGAIDEFVVFERILDIDEIRCLADRCVETCWNSCSSKSSKCDPAPTELQDMCPNPEQAVLVQSESENKGTTESKGPVSNAASEFDGKSYRQFPPMVLGGEVSFSFWARIDDASSWQRVFDFGNGSPSDNVLAAAQGTSNNMVFYNFDASKANIQEIVQGITFKEWHHWTCTSNHKGVVQLYRDGKKFGEMTTKSHDSPVARIERKLNYLGKSNWGHDKGLKGAVDGFMVFQRILKEKEIECLGSICPGVCTNGAPTCAAYGEFCRIPKCAVIYSECGFKGESQEICGDEPKLESQYVKSIHVDQGAKFSLYNGHEFQGQVAVFYKSVECIDEIDFKDPEQLEKNGVQLIKKNVSVKRQYLKRNQKN